MNLGVSNVNLLSNYNSATMQKQANVSFQKNVCGKKTMKLLDSYVIGLYMVPENCKDSFFEKFVNTIDNIVLKAFGLSKKI